MRSFPLVIILVTLLYPKLSMAKEGCAGDCFSCHSLSIKEAAELTLPLNVKVKSVSPSPIAGLFKVSAEQDGKEGIIFVDFAKKYLMQGVMAKVDDLKVTPVKIKEKPDVSKLMSVNSVLIGNPKASKQIFVFSDPDCPFCRAMHAELLQLVADMDIAVYIKPFPADIHPGAYEKSQTILEMNSLEILNKAFAGEEIPHPKDVNNKSAIEDVIGLAKSLGIKGTPAILLPNGKIEVGFRNVASLKKMLRDN